MDTLLKMAFSNAAMATVLALFVWLVTWRCRRPALVHGLWVLVLLKLITPPLLPLNIPMPAAGESVESLPMVIPAQAEIRITSVSIEPTRNWTIVDGLLWLWAIGIVWMLLSFVIQLRRFFLLKRLAHSASESLEKETHSLSEKIGLRRYPKVLCLPGRFSPFVWAFSWRAIIFLPQDLLTKLNPDQQRTLLAHELAHLRRGDHWVRLLELLTLALFWWHPIVWLARRQIQEAEEQCCDGWVTSLLPSCEKAYALALVQTVEFLSAQPSPLPVGVSGLGRVPQLTRRITSIMKGETMKRLTWLSGLTLLILGVLLLPIIPTLADEADPGKLNVEVTASPKKPSKKDLQKAREKAQRLEKQLKEQLKRVREMERALGHRPPAPSVTVPARAPRMGTTPAGPAGYPANPSTRIRPAQAPDPRVAPQPRPVASSPYASKPAPKYPMVQPMTSNNSNLERRVKVLENQLRQVLDQLKRKSSGYSGGR